MKHVAFDKSMSERRREAFVEMFREQGEKVLKRLYMYDGDPYDDTTFPYATPVGREDDFQASV